MPYPTSLLRTAAASALLLAALAFAAAGCSIKQFALTRVANSFAETGDTFEADDDPDLIGAALPFSLKLMESLAGQVPRHQGVRLACARGFTSYAYAYVQQPAEMEGGDLASRDEAYLRARRLYARGLEYGLAALDRSYPSFSATLRDDPATAVRVVRREHVPLLYWTAASLGLGIALSVEDAAMLGRLREVDALLDRALALDEAWGRGALHEFAITLEGARRHRPGRTTGGAADEPGRLRPGTHGASRAGLRRRGLQLSPRTAGRSTTRCGDAPRIACRGCRRESCRQRTAI
jgi:hypothetical protein